MSLVAQVIMSGTYFPPPSPCGICEYNVSFVAPAVQCENVTQETDFDFWLPQYDGGFPYVWASGYYYGAYEGYLIVASRDLVGSSRDDILPIPEQPTIGLNCTGWNATYHVNLVHNISTTVAVNSVEMGQRLTTELWYQGGSSWAHQIHALWDAFARQLTQQQVQWVESQNEVTSNSSWVAYSPFGAASGIGLAWGWAENLQDMVPDAMTNITLSLLADRIVQGATAPHDTVCRTSDIRYSYDRARLLLTYGVALLLTMVCMMCGHVAIFRNKRPESLGFSRILTACPPGAQGHTPQTEVQAIVDGQLYVRL